MKVRKGERKIKRMRKGDREIEGKMERMRKGEREKGGVSEGENDNREGERVKRKRQIESGKVRFREKVKIAARGCQCWL